MDIFGRMFGYQDAYCRHDLMPGLPLAATFDIHRFEERAGELGFTQPFDPGVAAAFVDTLKFAVREFGADIGCTHVDEITLLWVPASHQQPHPFSGRSHKVASVFASMIAIQFTDFLIGSATILQRPTVPLAFSGRAFVMPDLAEAANYVFSRELYCLRHAARCEYIKAFGRAPDSAMTAASIEDILFKEMGINTAVLDPIYRRGYYVDADSQQMELPLISSLPNKTVSLLSRAFPTRKRGGYDPFGGGAD